MTKSNTEAISIKRCTNSKPCVMAPWDESEKPRMESSHHWLIRNQFTLGNIGRNKGHSGTTKMKLQRCLIWNLSRWFKQSRYRQLSSYKTFTVLSSWQWSQEPPCFCRVLFVSYYLYEGCNYYLEDVTMFSALGAHSTQWNLLASW